MATDSTELTFVRCPSCRSLVPAMSKSCRYCGVALEAGAGAKGGEETPSAEATPRKSGRVRQRTMSQSNEELTSAVGRIRDEMSGGTSPGNGTPVEEEAPVTTPTSTPRPVAAQQEVAADESAEVEDPLSAYLEEVEVPGASTAKVVAKPLPPELRAVEPRSEPVKSFEEPPMPSKVERSVKPAPIDDDFDLEEEVPRRAVTPANRGDDDRARSIEVPKRNVTTGGRLYGWLVTYAQDPDGRAIELREGKFFITRKRIKDSDLVIDQDSISTPHALCALGSDSVMKIQDLMSDDGVFIRRKGESDFEKISEVAEVSHGDSIQFGKAEFVVCLVSEVGVK